MYAVTLSFCSCGRCCHRICQSELLYADDIVLMSEIHKRLMDKFLEWKEAFERKAKSKVNLCKTNLMVSGEVALQRMACLKVRLTHVGSAA